MNSYLQSAVSGLLPPSVFSSYKLAAIKALSIAAYGQFLSSGIFTFSAQAAKSSHPMAGKLLLEMI